MTTRIPEKTEQANIVKLLRSIGAAVYTLGTVRRKGDHPGTCQTPGICDLVAFLPARWGAARLERELLMIEVKAEGGRLSPSQKTFRDLCWDVPGVNYVTGGCDEVIAWLTDRGYINRRERA